MEKYRSMLNKTIKILLGRALATYCLDNNISLAKVSPETGIDETTLKRLYHTSNIPWTVLEKVLYSLNQRIKISLLDIPTTKPTKKEH